PARTCSASPTRSAGTRGSAVRRCAPGLGLAAGACPRTTGAWGPGPPHSAGGGRRRSLPRSTRYRRGPPPPRGTAAPPPPGGARREGRRVGVLGLAFKPGSDDIRDSPALEVAARIRALGARVAAFDPAAMDRARRVHPDLDYAGSVLGAARDADVLLLLTEWP